MTSAGVFRQVALTWQGSEHAFVPSLRLMRRLEGDGVSPVALAESFGRREPRIAQLAYMLAVCLAEAGCKGTTEDDLYLMLADKARQGPVIDLAQQVLAAFFPDVADPKKPEAPGAPPTPAA